jgi:hypothetical protein
LTFITGVMSALTANQGTIPNLPPGQIASFDTLNSLQDSISLPLFSPDMTVNPPLPIFNFALARVHMQAASTDPAMVRVFFRCFRASSTATGYETDDAYRYLQVAPGYRIPLLGKGEGTAAGQYATIPFFATARVNRTAAMTSQLPDTPNVQLMQTGTNNVPSGGTVQAFFGCWLDINQSTPLFPIEMPTNPAQIDGPFFSGTPPKPVAGITPVPIQAAFANDSHQCLVAEISFYTPSSTITDDNFFPPAGDNPEYSAWLAQRNLALLPTPNPGLPLSRRVLNIFDIKGTSPALAAGAKPDEIMFDWSGLPAGSTATIYLPSLAADTVVANAASLYGPQPFSVVDPHTLRCEAKGIAFMPVPSLSGNCAGLLDIELPAAIRKGEKYSVGVRQITNATAIQVTKSPIGGEKRALLTWRKIAGTFQLAIPISSKALILPDAEREFSILRWIFDATPRKSRWYPVMERYLVALAERIEGLGGRPSSIPPTVTGVWTKQQ